MRAYPLDPSILQRRTFSWLRMSGSVRWMDALRRKVNGQVLDPSRGLGMTWGLSRWQAERVCICDTSRGRGLDPALHLWIHA